VEQVVQKANVLFMYFIHIYIYIYIYIPLFINFSIATNIKAAK
jgi:hypothetical protein